MSSHYSAGRFSVLAYQPGNAFFPTLPDITESPTGWSRLGNAVLGGATPKRRSRTPRSDSAGPGLFGASEGGSFWYLDQIFVQPQPIDFGNISGERVRGMTVFHTKRSAIELTSIDLSPVQPGVTFDGISLPRLIRPYTAISFDVIASVQGLAAFDAAVPFTFEDAEDAFPHIDSISPTSVLDETASQTITITGENFTTNSIARFAGDDRDTTFTSATELSMELEAGDMDEPGEFTIRVFDPNRGQSNGKVFTVEYLTPTVSDVTAAAPDGEGDVVLTVDGADFYDSVSVVRYNEAELATTFVSAAQITALLPAANVAESGAIAIDVDTNGKISDDFDLPTPTLDSVAPTEIDSGQTVVLSGQGFFPHSVARADGVAQPTTFDSETQLTVAPTATGTLDITVFNPSPGGGESAAETLTVNAVFNMTSIGDATPVIDVDSAEMYGGGGGSLSDGTNLGGNLDLSGADRSGSNDPWGAVIGDTITVDFDRTYHDSWYDDDFSDAGFNVHVFFEVALGSISLPHNDDWQYDRPERVDNGIGVMIHHRRTHTKRPRMSGIDGTGTDIHTLMAEQNSGDSSEDSGPVHEQLVFEKTAVDEITCSYYIDGTLRFQEAVTYAPWETMTPVASAALIFHYHRYTSTSLGVEVNNVEVAVGYA